MAEIHLEKRRGGMAWVWLLVALIVGLIVWWVLSERDEELAESGAGAVALSIPAPVPSRSVVEREVTNPRRPSGPPLVNEQERSRNRLGLAPSRFSER